jgi:hypothetical protein
MESFMDLLDIVCLNSRIRLALLQQLEPWRQDEGHLLEFHQLFDERPPTRSLSMHGHSWPAEFLQCFVSQKAKVDELLNAAKPYQAIHDLEITASSNDRAHQEQLKPLAPAAILLQKPTPTDQLLRDDNYRQ